MLSQWVKKLFFISTVSILLLFLTGPILAATSNVIAVTFSGETESSGIPKGWKKAWFNFSPRHTVYVVENDNGKWVLKAESRNSASAIYKEVSIDPGIYPLLTWRWKISNIIKAGDETTKAGDDYAARVYVLFEARPEKLSSVEVIKRMVVKAAYGEELPGEAIVYVWANRLRKNSFMPNPDTDKAVMVAVESGSENTGRWMPETRNVYDDYKVFFKAEPARITNIAIMTDTDNTGEEATAWYDDMTFHNTKPGNFR